MKTVINAKGDAKIQLCQLIVPKNLPTLKPPT